MKKQNADSKCMLGKADINEPVDESSSSMLDLTSGAPREGYCSEDRHGRSIEDDALLRDRWIAAFETAQRPPGVAEIMISIHAGAHVVQLGPEHHPVTAPLEVIPRPVRARDCTLQPTCKVVFFEQDL